MTIERLRSGERKIYMNLRNEVCCGGRWMALVQNRVLPLSVTYTFPE